MYIAETKRPKRCSVMSKPIYSVLLRNCKIVSLLIVCPYFYDKLQNQVKQSNAIRCKAATKRNTCVTIKTRGGFITFEA